METVSFRLDGRDVAVEATAPMSLLDALRGPLGVTSVKDGCSPQGQCGCCTVLVDGEPRVACVTPLRRVAGREVTSFDGLDTAVATTWCDAFVGTGASQCGFCTPGIVVRLEWLRRRGSLGDAAAVERSLAAHLCRCTGWQSITEAAELVAEGREPDAAERDTAERDLDAAARRATIEGRSAQAVGAHVVGGRGGFAADTAPPGARVALRGAEGEWLVDDGIAALRQRTGKVQGRHSTATATHPIEVPDGDWVATLQTGWVEPAYLEVDTSWCAPGGDPADPLANGGAFGGKVRSPVPAIAQQLADEHARTVVASWSREDVVRFGPKRPPLAGGVAADGTGRILVARCDGIVDAIHSVAPQLEVVELDVAGPPRSVHVRGAGWVEAAVLIAAATGAERIVSPDGSSASATVADDGSLSVTVCCGDPLDAVVLRSYCIGAAHMALGWVTSEAIAVDEAGEVHDLTIRSFGILKASDTPRIDVRIEADDGPPRNGSDAVFAAVALAVWRAQGLPTAWPTGIALRP